MADITSYPPILYSKQSNTTPSLCSYSNNSSFNNVYSIISTFVDDNSITTSNNIKLPDTPKFDIYYRDSESIITQLNIHQNYIVGLLTSNPEELVNTLWNTGKSPLSIDTHCRDNLRKMARMTPMQKRTHRKRGGARWNPNQRCPACSFMYKLVDLDNINLDQKLNLYNFNGQYQLITYESLTPIITLNDNVINRLETLINNYNMIVECEPRLLNLMNASFVQCDSMTSYVLVSLLTERILSGLGIPTGNNIVTSFICGNDGYVFKQSYNKFNNVLMRVARSSLNSLDNVVEQILIQIISTLHALSHYDLNLVDFELNSLAFDLTPCSYTYDGLTVTSDFTFKLDNLEGSSITWYQPMDDDLEAVRVYSSNKVSELIVDDIDLDPKVETVPFTFYDNIKNGDMNPTRVTMYSIGGGVLENLKSGLLKSMGYPMFQSSLNTYVMLISLMSEPQIRKTVYASDRLSDIFSSMFAPQQYNDLVIELEKLNNDSTNDDILEVLSKYYLRCDGTQHMWNKLKSNCS